MTQLTVLTGPERRRRCSEADRRRILSAAFSPGAVVTDVARQFDVSKALIYKWRQQARAEVGEAMFVPVTVADGLRADQEPASPATIAVPSGARIWVATGVTDMRKGMNGLALLVQEGLKRDPYLCLGRNYVAEGARRQPGQAIGGFVPIR